MTPGVTDDAPPSDAVVLFDGGDLSAWKGAGNWRVENGAMIVGKGAISSKQHFGDCQLHVEWAAPVAIEGEGQGRGNSGVFLMGVYEVQVLDSFENATYPDGQAGAIYKEIPPMVNAMRPPGDWNTYDIFWTRPRFADGAIKPATVTVLHNGLLVVNHHVLHGETKYHHPHTYYAFPEKGPIKLQDHGNPVRFRNIWVRELNPPVGKPREAIYHDHGTGEKWPAKKGPTPPSAKPAE